MMTEQSSQKASATDGTAIPGVRSSRSANPNPNPDIADDAPDDTGARKQQEQLLAALQKRKDNNVKDLSEAEKQILHPMTCIQGSNGVLAMYDPAAASGELFGNGNGSGGLIARISGHEVSYDFREPFDSKENAQYNIDLSIKTSLAYKAAPHDIGNNVFLNGPDDVGKLIDAKVDSLIGLHDMNPPAKTLDEVNPALARQVEETCKRMGIIAPEKYDNNSTAGLVTTPSPLDTAPPVDRHFAAAVTPPVAAAAVTPAPAVAPKQALT